MRSGIVTCAVALLLLSACDSGGTPSSEPQAGDTPLPTVTEDNRAFCTAIGDLLATSKKNLGINPNKSSPKKIVKATKRWYGTSRAEELMTKAEDNAPAALAADISKLVTGIKEFARTGDLKAAQKSIGSIQAKVDRYRTTECPSD